MTLTRRTRLRANPDTTRAWRQRSRDAALARRAEAAPPAPRRGRRASGFPLRVRRRIRERAKGLCEVADAQACGVDGPHRGNHAHHVMLRSQGGGDTVGNGLWVCWRSHGWVHVHPELSYERGWLRRSGTGR